MENSWEVLKEAIDKKGIKYIAGELKLSQPLLYKWCQRPVSVEDDLASGATNPLDRVKAIYEKTEDLGIIQWVCQCADGFFVKNPSAIKKTNIIQHMQKLIKEFSDVLDATTASMEDKRITEEEAKKIRREWEHLKTLGESMVVSCEKKHYHLL